jgi:hypothetical protein
VSRLFPEPEHATPAVIGTATGQFEADRIIDGIKIRTELAKPTLMPLQASPVQASAQALTQGSKVTADGQARMLPRRTSSMVLSEVMTMIQSGSRKNKAAVNRKA